MNDRTSPETETFRGRVAKAIHEALGGDGWAYSNYGGDEWNDKRDALLAAADAAIESCGHAKVQTSPVSGLEPVAWQKRWKADPSSGWKHVEPHHVEAVQSQGWEVRPLYAERPDHAQSPGVPEGYALVPIVPTAKMIETGCENNPTQWTDETPDSFAAEVANDVYVSMVRAAASPDTSTDCTSGEGK